MREGDMDHIALLSDFLPPEWVLNFFDTDW